jgi:hypothetical protein
MNKKNMLLGLATATLLSGAAAYAAGPVKTKDGEQQAQTAKKKTVAAVAPRAKVRSAPAAKARPAQPKKIKAQTKAVPEIISPLEATDENRSGAEMGGGMKGGMGGIRR